MIAVLRRKLFIPAFCVLAVALFLGAASGCSKNDQQADSLSRQGWVTDEAGLLSPGDKARLSGTLEAFEKETCHQVYLLIIRTLKGEDIRDFSTRTAQAWDIGQPGFGNGILLTIAMQEGSIRLETGSAFEWFVEQGVSERILKEVMIPLFKQERFVEGIEQGLAGIMEAARLKVIPPDHRPDVCRR